MSKPQHGLDMLRNVDVCLSVELGKTTLRLKEVMALAEDSVVPLDRMTDELLDVMVNGRVIAKAEIIDQDGRFALRIAEMGDGEDDEAGDGDTPQITSAPASPAIETQMPADQVAN